MALPLLKPAMESDDALFAAVGRSTANSSCDVPDGISGRYGTFRTHGHI